MIFVFIFRIYSPAFNLINMKKMILSALALALAITVTSCKNENTEDNTEAVEETAELSESNLELNTEKVEDSAKVETEVVVDSLETLEVKMDAETNDMQ